MTRARRYLNLLLTYLRIPFSATRAQVLAELVDEGVFELPIASQPRITWSQDGEDIGLVHVLPELGRYVDVGAHDPFRFSVTKRLYDAGWRGVNIDASPEFSSQFERHRPEDINIECLIGPEGVADFWVFDEPALSTLDRETARERIASGWSVKEVRSMSIRPLGAVLRGCIEPGEIDLINIDVEGFDLAVLESHDWQNFPIRNALVEVFTPACKVADSEIGRYLIAQGLLPNLVWTRSVLFSRMDERET